MASLPISTNAMKGSDEFLLRGRYVDPRKLIACLKGLGGVEFSIESQRDFYIILTSRELTSDEKAKIEEESSSKTTSTKKLSPFQKGAKTPLRTRSRSPNTALATTSDPGIKTDTEEKPLPPQRTKTWTLSRLGIISGAVVAFKKVGQKRKAAS